MRKAFDANVPKLKPRLRPAGVATLDPEPVVEPEAAAPPPAVEDAIEETFTASDEPVAEPVEARFEPSAPAAPPAPVSRSSRAAARAAAVTAPPAAQGAPQGDLAE
ncbi:MAG: hypothetical protein RJA59_179, partial [Pseudomonadota bacterium]